MKQRDWMIIVLAIKEGAITPLKLSRKSGCTLAEAKEAIAILVQKDMLTKDGKFCGACESFSGGMTNHQINFKLNDENYLLRIPGEGTEKLINRNQEYEAYEAVKGRNITDEIMFFDPVSGCKVSRFIPKARSCNPLNEDDVKKCMALLRRLHNLSLCVSAEFDVYKKLALYEKLCRSISLPYEDWKETRRLIFSFKPFLKKLSQNRTLCHIDPVQDNFLFDKDGMLYLIDWEYAAMSDSDIDIAMFCIYAGYDLNQIDKAVDLYYNNECPKKNRAKITCYIAICGLLWTYWCEYKKKKGIIFESYERMQYNYAHDVAFIALKRLANLGLSKD